MYNDNLIGLLAATGGNVVYDRVLLFGEELGRDGGLKAFVSCFNKISLFNFSDFGLTAIIAPDYLLKFYHKFIANYKSQSFIFGNFQNLAN